jgi:AraC-like DNA-binding protein
VAGGPARVPARRLLLQDEVLAVKGNRLPADHDLRRARVEAARTHLLYAGLSLHTVARLSGFANEFHLSRVFKPVTGFTPSAFRQAGRGTRQR